MHMNEDQQIQQFLKDQQSTEIEAKARDLPAMPDPDEVLNRLGYELTHVAYSKLRTLMASGSNDVLTLKAISEWLSHVRGMKAAGSKSQGVVQVNFSFGTDKEVDNVRQIRAAAGISED